MLYILALCHRDKLLFTNKHNKGHKYIYKYYGGEKWRKNSQKKKESITKSL